MIEFSEILKRKAITKKEIALRIGIEQCNVNRTIESYEKYLTRIDTFLSILGTSLEKEFAGNETPHKRRDAQSEVSGITIPVEVFGVIQSQSETIRSQQKSIETLTYKFKSND